MYEQQSPLERTEEVDRCLKDIDDITKRLAELRLIQARRPLTHDELTTLTMNQTYLRGFNASLGKIYQRQRDASDSSHERFGRSKSAAKMIGRAALVFGNGLYAMSSAAGRMAFGAPQIYGSTQQGISPDDKRT